jgi:hypothetical protein
VFGCNEPARPRGSGPDADQYRLANGWTLIDRLGSAGTGTICAIFTPLLFFHDSDGHERTAELRLASSDTGRFVWLAGLSYYANEYRRGMGGKRPIFGPNGPLIRSALAVTSIPLALPGGSESMIPAWTLFRCVRTGHLGEVSSVGRCLRWQTEENRHLTIPAAGRIGDRQCTDRFSSERTQSMPRVTPTISLDLTPQYRQRW